MLVWYILSCTMYINDIQIRKFEKVLSALPPAPSLVHRLVQAPAVTQTDVFVKNNSMPPLMDRLSIWTKFPCDYWEPRRENVTLLT